MVYEKNRIFGLDLLRAFAILFVVHAHGVILLVPYAYSYRLTYFNFDGVSFFFVLSGFLIGRILLKTIAKDDFNGRMLLEFWIRRWCRTLPNYLLVLSALIIAYKSLGMELPHNLANYFIFSQNVASPHPDFFSEAWSLAVEEWFYLCLPIPLYLATRIRGLDHQKMVTWTIGILIVSITLFRCYRAYSNGYATYLDWDINLHKQVIMRLDSLMFGVAGAYMSLYRKDVWETNPGRWCVAGLMLIGLDRILSGQVWYLNYFSMTVVSVGTLMLLPHLSVWRRPDDILTRTITFFSVLSYSMYLLNLSVIQIVGLKIYSIVFPSATREPALLYCMYWVATIGGSYLLYNYFERHMTKIREMFNSKPISTTEMPASRSVAVPESVAPKATLV